MTPSTRPHDLVPPTPRLAFRCRELPRPRRDRQCGGGQRGRERDVLGKRCWCLTRQWGNVAAELGVTNVQVLTDPFGRASATAVTAPMPPPAALGLASGEEGALACPRTWGSRPGGVSARVSVGPTQQQATATPGQQLALPTRIRSTTRRRVSAGRDVRITAGTVAATSTKTTQVDDCLACRHSPCGK